MDSSKDRYPGSRHIYKKSYIMLLHNQTTPHSVIIPPMPINMEDLNNSKALSKLQKRHEAIIYRGLFCETCHELNESGDRWHVNFLSCFGCRQLACVLCISQIFPINYQSIEWIQQHDEETRKRMYLCITCRILRKEKLLIVSIIFCLYFDYIIFIF